MSSPAPINQYHQRSSWGVPLVHLSARDSAMVPVVVKVLIQHLDCCLFAPSVYCEDSFSAVPIQRARRLLEDCRNEAELEFVVKNLQSSFCVALLMSFLAAIPGRLLPATEFHSAVLLDGDQQVAQRLSSLVSQLPSPHRQLLAYLIAHCARICDRGKAFDVDPARLGQRSGLAWIASPRVWRNAAAGANPALNAERVGW